jgi:glutaminyl-tRNA synthetase
MSDLPVESTNFIREAVAEDLRSGRFQQVVTRFPPEPSGYLHIGHAKAICIDFGTALAFGGRTNLRFDDTNPVKEDVEYVESIMEDIHWLGYDWEGRVFFASDYFEQLFKFAIRLIEKGLAYVDDLSADEVREHRGTLNEPGRESPYRGRSIEENLDLFQRMRVGEFPDGSRTLRAKIDMASGNINLRDPVMYRIVHASHHRTGDKWCIYPMYDFAHGQSDSIEGVTHSLCDLAYEDHRPLYEWFLDKLEIFRSRQIEFSRLYMAYTVLSKRFLKQLVEEGCVSGWDDPRMPTLRGMRRRGYTADAIRKFIDGIGTSKKESLTDILLLENAVREDLNIKAPRVLGVLDPLKVVLTNYPESQVEELEATNNPEDATAGTRKVPFSNTLYIEREDFREDPPPKYFRLAPGREVRLRYGYIIKCEDFVRDPKTGLVTEVHCTYDPQTRGGYAPDGRRIQGTIHWVSVVTALDAEVRMYDRLFNAEIPGKGEGRSILNDLNPDSLKVVRGCKVEPSLAAAVPGDHFQFERKGFFCVDPDSGPGSLVFNLTVSLRDTWAKIEKKQQ